MKKMPKMCAATRLELFKIEDRKNVNKQLSKVHFRRPLTTQTGEDRFLANKYSFHGYKQKDFVKPDVE